VVRKLVAVLIILVAIVAVGVYRLFDWQDPLTPFRGHITSGSILIDQPSFDGSAAHSMERITFVEGLTAEEVGSLLRRSYPPSNGWIWSSSADGLFEAKSFHGYVCYGPNSGPLGTVKITENVSEAASQERLWKVTKKYWPQ